MFNGISTNDPDTIQVNAILYSHEIDNALIGFSQEKSSVHSHAENMGKLLNKMSHNIKLSHQTTVSSVFKNPK
jgi:hypothetical protein